MRETHCAKIQYIGLELTSWLRDYGGDVWDIENSVVLKIVYEIYLPKYWTLAIFGEFNLDGVFINDG